MANAKEIERYLQETGYSKEDMQKFFDDAAEVNFKVKLLKDSKHNWTNLSMYQIKQLPGLKELTLKQQKEKMEKEKQETMQKEAAKLKKEKYEKNFLSIMAEKISKKESLSEKELKRLTEESIFDEYSSELERWHREVCSIISLNNTHYCIKWKQGLTENQENEFPYQPFEVTKKEVTIKKTIWLPTD